jgi:hypothetical protein
MNPGWKIVKTEKGMAPVPDGEITCPVLYDGKPCGGKLLLHQFNALDTREKLGMAHCDVRLKCERCGWFTLFGIPLTDEEYEGLAHSRLNGQVITTDILLFTQDKEIRERLKRMGYW